SGIKNEVRLAALIKARASTWPPAKNLGLAQTKQPAGEINEMAKIGTSTTFEISWSIYNILLGQPCSRRHRIWRLKLHGAAIRADIEHYRGGRQNQLSTTFLPLDSAPRELHHRDQRVDLRLLQWPTVFYAAPHHSVLAPVSNLPCFVSGFGLRTGPPKPGKTIAG
ncbi:hypothetical protein THAOC_04687, partial [Thalassiosira oceanica]